MIRRGFQQFAHLGLRVFLKFHCGYRVRGRMRLTTPSVLVANHASHMDIAAIFAALPISEVSRVRTAAARDAIYTLPPILLHLVEFLFNTYPFERRSGSTASLERGEAYVREGYHLAIFPEGRRVGTRERAPFTPGFAKIAYRTGAPVVPIRIAGASAALPRGATAIQPRRIRVDILPELRADTSIPHSRRREAYSRLINAVEGSILTRA